jgi:L-glyceraldehyde 3-phosphate reductase
VLDREGIGAIAFSPLAQGMLTGKYLDGIPEDSRIRSDGRFLTEDMLTPERLNHIRSLNAIAAERGQSLAQLAIAWTLRDERVTSALIGASSVRQLEENVAAIDDVEFTQDEIDAIDRDAIDAGINIWEQSSSA